MQAIYTRTMRVTDDGLGKAMEICQGLAKVRKKYFPKHYESKKPKFRNILSKLYPNSF